MYVVGKTGTGKSTLITNMVVSDMQEGHGLALIDPHGDLAESLLEFIPKRRIKDVIYFNPADLGYPVAFNPLMNAPRDTHHLIVSGLIAVFKKTWPEFWGPRLEHILRHAIFTLLEYAGATLLDLPRLLTDKDFRASVLTSVTHPQVREFWFLEFEKYSAWLRSEAISPILNKVGQFLTTVLIRNIVGQRENSLNFRAMMDEGKIFIANLSKGKIGEDACALLGAMLITELQLAALSRAELPETARKAFYAYVDEIQSFFTLSFCDVLSEARKYGLSLVLAHQYLKQLDERVLNAILGNVGTLIAFRVGADDAYRLGREFEPHFTATDLTRLPNHAMLLKLMIDGMTSEPFSAIALPPPEHKTSRREEVIASSRRRYGRQRREVERTILFRHPGKSETKASQNRLFPV